jgi:hypothetical protein
LACRNESLDDCQLTMRSVLLHSQSITK